MKLPKLNRDELACRIQRRAMEIAAGEGDSTDIPLPGITVLQEPTGVFGIYWSLSDYQNARGLGYIRVAAAELSVQLDIAAD